MINVHVRAEQKYNNSYFKWKLGHFGSECWKPGHFSDICRDSGHPAWNQDNPWQPGTSDHRSLAEQAAL